MRRLLLILTLAGTLGAAAPAQAAVTLTVDSAIDWYGFLNVTNLPEDGGAYQFGNPAGLEELGASFLGDTLSLGVVAIDDPSIFWYENGGAPGEPGDKNMIAQVYTEVTGALAGEEVTFTGFVTSTFVNPYATIAFIKDYSADYSTFNLITAPLVNGLFSISLVTGADPTRHVQYGFETTGPNVWPDDVAEKGTVEVSPIPEPSLSVLLALGAFLGGAFLARRRAAG